MLVSTASIALVIVLFEFVLFDDDRINPQAGRKLDVVNRLQIGRV